MKDADLSTRESRLYHVVEERFIPLKAFIDMLSTGSDDEYHAIADILLSLYDDNFKKIVEDFEAVEQKVGNVRIIYSTAYNPDISPGTVLDLKIISHGEDAPIAASPQEKPKPITDPPKKENSRESYADDLVDHITLGYSAVYDTLKRIHKEQDSDVQASLADVGMVLYKNAVDRTCQVISELEKKTGRIEVLVDEGRGYGGYDMPVMGVLIHPKEDPASKETSAKEIESGKETGHA
ncbi:MAG: hypothetical protein ACLQBD_01930 [Syntrophobacteraceae bacterium]